MAIISLRLNKNDENIINFLSEYYEKDKSSLIRHSLKELYEDIIDKQIINEFEAKEKTGKIKFIDSNKIIYDKKRRK